MIANLGYPFFTGLSEKQRFSFDHDVKNSQNHLAFFGIILSTLGSFDFILFYSKVSDYNFPNNFNTISIEKVIESRLDYETNNSEDKILFVSDSNNKNNKKNKNKKKWKRKGTQSKTLSQLLAESEVTWEKLTEIERLQFYTLVGLKNEDKVILQSDKDFSSIKEIHFLDVTILFPYLDLTDYIEGKPICYEIFIER